MKYTLAVLCVAVTLALVVESSPAGKGYTYILGRRKAPCPDNTHSYLSPCSSRQTLSQRTCDEPVAREIGFVCDMSRCDCDEPLVKDLINNVCVPLEDCPKNEESSKTVSDISSD